MPFVWSCIDQQWYERQGHMKCLMDAYRRSDDDERQGRHRYQHHHGGRKLVLISGPSGVGKTSLAMTLQDAVKRDGGFFCQGKFDPTAIISALDTPSTSSLSPIRNDNIQMSYGPFIAAMTQYVDQVLVRGRAFSMSIQSVLNLLLDASEREVLEESIPALRKLTRVQQQPTTTSASSSPQHHHHNNHHDHINDTTRWLGLKGLDAEKRYIHLFTRLVQAVCTPDHAMVMLVDDLQWADPNSLQLLRALTTCTTNGLMLIICTARNKIQEQLPPATTTSSSNNDSPMVFSQLFLDLKEAGVTITEIQLGLLRQHDVTYLLSDLLELPAAEVQPLSTMVHQVTHGNLFFLVQLLNAWQEEEILVRSPETNNIWTWDEHRVRETVACSDSPPSLLDFLTGRVLKLPEYDQRLLQTASCLAASGTVYEKLLEETVLPAASVRPALRLSAELGFLHCNPQTGTGSFAHDRIQEAIYSLIPPNERAKRHLDIGLRLWIWLPPSENETHLFTIVGQIILGLHVLEDDPIEREDLAKLMLRAARKAAQMSAFSKAATYIQVGMSLLMERNHWKYQYDVSLALYNAAVEVEYFNGNLAQVDLLLTEIFTNAKTLDHKMQAYFTQIYSLYSRDDAQQAFAKALEVLSLSGVTFPRNPGKARVAYAWGHCKWLLQGKDDNAIMNLPIMTDRRKLVVMRLLALTTTAAALINFHFVALTVSRMISYTMRDGISDISCFCFAILGVCLGRRGQLKDEYRLGRLALQLMDKFDAREWQCRVILLHCSSGRQKLQEQIKLLQSAHRAGLVAGDIQDSMVCASRLCRVYFFSAARLPDVVAALIEYKSLCHQYSQLSVGTMLSHQLQLCYNFMGRSRDPVVLSGDEMNEDETVVALQGRHMSTLAWLLIMKHMLAVYFNDHSKAFAISNTLSGITTSAIMPVVLRIHLFHQSLSAASMSHSSFQQTTRARQILSKLKSCPHGHSEDFENKICLVEAEMADRDEAILKYEQSIKAAEREGFLHEQALASEMAGRARLRWGQAAEARDYLILAQSVYRQWDADAKVRQMDEILNGF